MTNKTIPRTVLAMVGFFFLVSLGCGWVCFAATFLSEPDGPGEWTLIAFVCSFFVAIGIFSFIIALGLLRRKPKSLKYAKGFAGAVIVLFTLGLIGAITGAEKGSYVSVLGPVAVIVCFVLASWILWSPSVEQWIDHEKREESRMKN